MTDSTHDISAQVDSIEQRIRRARLYVLSVLVVVFGAYVLNFASRRISQDTDAWGQFGDYVGGLLNPVVGLVTLYWLIQQVRLTAELVRLERTEARRVRMADRFATLYDEMNTSDFGDAMAAAGRWLNELAKKLGKSRSSLTGREISDAYSSFYLKLDRGDGAPEAMRHWSSASAS